MIKFLPLPLTGALALLLLLLIVFRCRRPRELTRAFQPFSIVSRRIVSSGHRPTIFLTVRVSTASLPTGAHVKLRALLPGAAAPTIRSYTPTRFHKGECELMFRVYSGGPMTQHLASLRVGDAVDMMGPTGLERYGEAGPGTFSRGTHMTWREISHVGMIAGGTGVTPMLQIANHVLQDPLDSTALHLLSFCNSCDDFMLEEELAGLAGGSGGQMRLTLIASKMKGEEVKRRPGVVHASMRELKAGQLKVLLGLPAGPSTMVCVCGPDGFVTKAKELLAEAGVENVLVW